MSRTMTTSEVEFALDIARRAAIAIDNAQLYGAAAERAQAARVLASVGDGVFFVDRAGVIRTWNRAAAIATGPRCVRRRRPPRSRGDPGLVGDRRRGSRSRRAGSAAPRPESLPLDLGGRELWLSIHGVAVPDGVVYAFRDLTEERALERMRTEFVSTVSHELRTPLAAIYGAAMTLRRSDVSIDDDAARLRLLDIVSGEADRLARTVNDILWASRLDTDTLNVTIQNCDPLALVDQVVTAQEVHLDRSHRLLVDSADRRAARRRRPGQGRPRADQPRRQRGQVLAGRRQRHRASAKARAPACGSRSPTRASASRRPSSAASSRSSIGSIRT